jgi:hypothetical protein
MENVRSSLRYDVISNSDPIHFLVGTDFVQLSNDQLVAL